MENARSTPLKRYWGYRCVKCEQPLTITPYEESTAWIGSQFTIPCFHCESDAVYPLSDIQIPELSES